MATPAAADPLLSIDITLAEGEGYADAAEVIRDAGAVATSLSLFWDDLEPAPGVYAPAHDWPALANATFPVTGLDYTLTFSVIDTVADRRPTDLQGRPWDDPRVIARFAAHLTAVLDTMPDVPIIAIAIGNEVDAHLTDPVSVAAYARFLAAARAHLATLRPGVPVAAKLTFAGLAAAPARLQPILDAGDAAFVTYYPLTGGFFLRPPTDAPADLDRMIALAKGKPLWLLEAGYPSDGCGAPVDGQADFVRAMQAAVAARADKVALLSFTFLTDLPQTAVNDLAQYYSAPGDCFRRYLGSLGLRMADGTPKPALAALSP